MAKIKSYTDLEQSRKLAEILPLESADMCYIQDLLANCKYGDYKPYIGDLIPAYGQDKIRCWSLSALLGVLPMIRKGEDTANPFIAKTPDNEYYIVYATLTEEVDASPMYDNPVDVCYKMILKLYELKML